MEGEGVSRLFNESAVRYSTYRSLQLQTGVVAVGGGQR